jgi:ABC-type uncharacterized transport system involved in gliding motility auxiliary subunit
MSSAGSISAMITSLKNNAALRKAVKFKKSSTIFKSSSRKNIRLQFKELTPREIVEMKKRIRKKARRQNIAYLLIFLVMAVLTIIGMYFLFNGLFW